MLKDSVPTDLRTFSYGRESQVKTQVVFQAKTEAEIFLLNRPQGDQDPGPGNEGHHPGEPQAPSGGGEQAQVPTPISPVLSPPPSSPVSSAATAQTVQVMTPQGLR